MQDVHGILNPGLPDKSGIQQVEDPFTSNDLKYDEEADGILHLEHSSVWR